MSTIAAIASPVGAGGVGIIRISGPDALSILKRAVKAQAKDFCGFKPRVLHHALLLDGHGESIDECLVVHMPAPHTFTGEDVAEIHCHGNPLIVQLALERCLDLGARQAERGEFTRRAFLNGRMDLSQAEAVAELVAAPSREALRYSLERLSGNFASHIRALQADLTELSAHACVAIDFPDDEVPPLSREDFILRAGSLIDQLEKLLLNAKRANSLQHGCRVLLLGPVNAGKSSLLNALSGRKRALVSEQPGTTRDYLEADLLFDDLPVRLIDTAGIRAPGQADPVEALGIERSLELLDNADLIWLVLDIRAPSSGLDEVLERMRKASPTIPVITLLNKSDLLEDTLEIPAALADWPVRIISALTGGGLDELARESRAMLLRADSGDGLGLAPNRRQARELEQALSELEALRTDLEAGQAFDACICNLDAANSYLDAVLGVSSHDELLDKIFSQFCIGK